jgi:hypothetical protein
MMSSYPSGRDAAGVNGFFAASPLGFANPDEPGNLMFRYFRPQSALQRLYRAQLLRMLGVVAAIAGLAFWARDFIWAGILSNAYLNTGILLVFLFGVVMAFLRVTTLWNEENAFEALQEAHDDIRRDRNLATEDPYWRHYRALKPGRVFSKPRLLSHSFELTYDEMLRSRTLRMSVGTMNSVVGALETRISEDRSILNYLTGLLVFLGLIGTFIGLMEMVGSVGGVIGKLNSSASGGNSTAAMNGLLTSLEQPLRGMATGFSSSLFGLFGSLVLGLLTRIGAVASNALKHAFETWLVSVTQLDGPGRDEASQLARLVAENMLNPGAAGGGTGQAAASGITDVGIVATMANGFGRTNSSIEKIAEMVPRMMEVQAEQIGLLRALATSVERLAGDSGEIRSHLVTLAAAQTTTQDYMQEMIGLNRSIETRLTSGFNGMAHVMEVTGQAYLDGLRRLTSENYETNARLAKLLDVKAAGDRITEIAVGIESKIKNGMGSLVTSLERTAVTIETSMQRFANEQAEMKTLMQSQGSGHVGMTPEFEQRLSNGFSDLSRSFETVFAAYSTLINRAVLTQALGEGEPAPLAGPAQTPAGTVIPEHAMKTDKPEKPDVDHDEMRERLYRMASAMRQTGTGQGG